jgi:hypothetical protein
MARLRILRGRFATQVLWSRSTERLFRFPATQIAALQATVAS